MQSSAGFATRWLALALSLFLCVPVASAQEQTEELSATADEADVEFRLGNEAYRKGDFREALSHYFASNRLVPNRNVTFNIAKCYENLDEFVQAYRYYSTYLQGIEKASERKDVEKAISRISKRVGLLDLKSDPDGATIYLNRRDLGSYGVTPSIVPVEPGTYKVILDRPGFEAAAIDDVEVKPGKVIPKRVELSRREGTVRLEGSPRDVIVEIPDLGPTEVSLPAEIAVPVGSQTLVVRADGYDAGTVEVDVRDKKTSTASIELLRQRGTLVVKSTELNSAVLLNGELLGFTPAVIPNVTVGTYELSVRQEGFDPFISEVTIEADDRVEIDAVLTAANEVAAASRSVESLRDAPASVSLISSGEIDAFAYTGTADALKGTRGIYFTNDKTYRLIGVRGYGPFGQFGNRMLLQLDGHTLNDSWVEQSYHEFEIMSDISGLERIEVVRGPNSVLYGSGAFQGVVSLVSPAIDAPYSPSSVGVSAVDDGTFRTYGYARETFEGGGIQLSAAAVSRQPRDFVSEARIGSAENPDGLAREVEELDAYTLRANGKFHDFELRTFLHERDKGVPSGAYETIFGDKRTSERDRRGFVDLRWQPKFDGVELETRLFYDHYNYRGIFPYEEGDGGVFQDNFEGHWGGLEARVGLTPFEGAKWSFGAEFTRHFIQNTDSFAEEDGTILDLETPFSKTSVTAVIRQELGEYFGIWAGGRFDLWLFDSLPTADGGEESREINNFNPRVVLFGRPSEKNVVKAIFARGFRAPSLYELTYNDGGFTQVASPGVEPEAIWSGELEYNQLLPDKFEAVGSVFVNQIQTPIVQLGSATEDDPLFYTNADVDLWSAGAELELRRPFFRGWMASAQYSFQRTRAGELGDVFSSDEEITNSPEHLAAIKIVAPLIGRSLRLANRIRYESKRFARENDETDEVILWDFVFSGQSSAIPLRYAFRVENVLDWNVRHPVGDEILDTTIQQPGRTFLVDLSLQF